ncbi:hypothetical protein BDE02_02G147000 [Populus trichocarpa]|nr:hypothetical protein BDE02_02G147000 [Populus trichocarpa]
MWFMFVHTLLLPIIYKVQRIRDGKSFATRKADAVQKGNIAFTLMASFQLAQRLHITGANYILNLDRTVNPPLRKKEEHMFVHQQLPIPAVPEQELVS